MGIRGTAPGAASAHSLGVTAFKRCLAAPRAYDRLIENIVWPARGGIAAQGIFAIQGQICPGVIVYGAARAGCLIAAECAAARQETADFAVFIRPPVVINGAAGCL